ncbi:VOC family protein [Sphingomonas profundi]|uniref:VOC family protein n=1 Tax=Alterirhizorhabdus profundi TaxID=2681549 RepID=UPI0012E7CDB4|nr:VOC family protein [Sphingomonas profundi]
MTSRHAIIPNLRYADARGAIAFLCAAFGFTEKAIHADPDDDATILHAQLLYEGQMIMLSSAVDTEYSRAAPLRTVRQAGGNTQSLYVVVDDVDRHAARARAAGADIYMEPENKDYGGRGYSARDPEGNAWAFGDYDPFA